MVTVVVKEPGKAPAATAIEDSPEGVQKIVGGYFEEHNFDGTHLLLCAEERPDEPSPNIYLPGLGGIAGPVIVTRVNSRGNLVSLKAREIDEAVARLKAVSL